MKMELTIRFDYGSIIPWVRQTDTGLWAIAGPDALHLYTPIELRGQGYCTVADFTVSEGQRVPFTLTWHPSYRTEPRKSETREGIAKTEAWVVGNAPALDT